MLMYKDDTTIRLRAGDLVNDLACPHLTELNLDVVWQRRGAPFLPSLLLDQWRRRGLAHETAYLEHLERSGPRSC